MPKLAKRIALTAVLLGLELVDGVALVLRSVRASDWANDRWERAYRRLDGLVNGPS
ncbi:hypothetical protein [Caulobacter sp. Root343]|uniref:hypothetical protein n=1 Tax=Caulobacter sp. Root343 TaxID=1736520 RepID=UPI000AAFFC4F|nr:hypothetical protein [Caulobacter sp. Root343]